MSHELNTWLRRKIDEKGLSERAVSTYSGLSPGAVWHILNHPENNPRPKTCRKLAAFFKVDADYVLALAGHRIAQVPPERRDYPPEVMELIDSIVNLPPELQVAALRIARRAVEDLEAVGQHYAQEEEERLERAGRAA